MAPCTRPLTVGHAIYCTNCHAISCAIAIAITRDQKRKQARPLWLLQLSATTTIFPTGPRTRIASHRITSLRIASRRFNFSRCDPLYVSLLSS
jgi:hypothetical protein